MPIAKKNVKFLDKIFEKLILKYFPTNVRKPVSNKKIKEWKIKKLMNSVKKLKEIFLIYHQFLESKK